MIKIVRNKGIIEFDGEYTCLLKEYIIIKNILKHYTDEQGFDFENIIKASEERSKEAIDEAVKIFFENGEG